jgi:hypothetical protein
MGRSGALAGLGPKQARNLWQCLGVTRYEIPLDIRVYKWINALPSDFRLNPKKLYANVAYYEEAMTHIQSVCREAEVLYHHTGNYLSGHPNPAKRGHPKTGHE